MRLLADLWLTSPRRSAAVALLVLLSAGGTAAAAALAGPVLLHRSGVMFALLATALAGAVVGDVLVNLVAAGLTADWAADVRRRLCAVAFGQPLPVLEQTPVGELLDRIDNDVYQVSSEMRTSGVRAVQMMCTAVLAMLTAFIVWWPAAVAMLLLAATLVLSLRRLAGRIAPARMAEEEAWSDLAAVMEEAIHGQDDVRTSLARPYVLKLYARRASRVLAAGRVVWGLSARLTVIPLAITRSGVALVVLGGVWAIATGRIDGARLTSTWLLTVAFAAVVESGSRVVPKLQHTLGSWDRIRLLAGSAQEPIGGLAPTGDELTVRGLTFRYDNGHRALNDVTLTFSPGRSYAVIGRTGSGKSTLAKVLTRAVEVPRGTVFLGGTDLCDIDLDRLRRWVAVVPQRTDILAGTLAENIALFDPELIGRAAEAIRELGLDAWVDELPDGLDTRLGDGGYALSAGQEQLVAFARILVRDLRAVILDEATARLDPVTEATVQLATERLLRDRIGIVIAHRLSSVQRCDEVVVLADGQVVEAGSLGGSKSFADLLAASGAEPPASPAEPPARTTLRVPPKATPPDLSPDPPVHTLREVFRLIRNDPRYGLSAFGHSLALTLLGLDGPVLAWLWVDVVDGVGDPLWPMLGLIAGLFATTALAYPTFSRLPRWWASQLLRIGLRLVHGQTGPRRISRHTPAEVIAQSGDTERVVVFASGMADQFIAFGLMIGLTIFAGSFVPGLFFLGAMALAGLAALLCGPPLQRRAARTVAARAAFATALASALGAARTVKLAGATGGVLDHLMRLERDRSRRQCREIAMQVWARTTPALTSGLLPVAAWALYLAGALSAEATLVAVATMHAARWFAWNSASLVSQYPSAKVWTARTTAMVGAAGYSASVPGVDLVTGRAPAPNPPPRRPLRRLDLVGFGTVYADGTLGVHRVDLTVRRGELVLVIGPVGAGKSSLLRALAGITSHTGDLRWNGEPVTEPELFLRPNQVGYVAQLPRVLSGTIAENIHLGHDVEVADAVAIAQLEHDLAPSAERAGGLELSIGHKGTRLSGGQLQRLALARALAPRTELLVADDISSALDVTTELDLWRALRAHGVTVVGSTAKRAALARADRVLVLIDGTVAAQGTWRELRDDWGHLAG
ncbi:ABC transporter ATP-binding protein [Micromonosporaceae bacterium B7E4]